MLRMARSLKWGCLFGALKPKQPIPLLSGRYFGINKQKFGFTFIKNNQM